MPAARLHKSSWMTADGSPEMEGSWKETKGKPQGKLRAGSISVGTSGFSYSRASAPRCPAGCRGDNPAEAAPSQLEHLERD